MSKNKVEAKQPFQFDKPGTYSIPASVMHLDSKVPFKLFAVEDAEEAPAEDNAEVADDSGKHPIAMLARTGEAIEHWYWGKIVHDLNGFKLLKDKVTVDWCHDYSQSIGYLDQFEVDDAGLNTKGFLIPHGEDITSEVIAKGKAGVPYEASIDWTGQGTRIEFVPEGISTQANGKSFDGPIYVVREWPLTAVALCPHGADPGTLTQFSKNDAVEINIFTAEAPAEAPAVEAEVTEVASAEVQDVQEEEKQEAPAETKQDKAPAIPAAEAKSDIDSLRLFVGTFGNQATEWFLAGKSFADCTKLALGELTEKLTQKDKVIADLEKRLHEVRLGESEPVTFSAVEVVETDKRFADLGSLGKYASAIKLPSR